MWQQVAGLRLVSHPDDVASLCPAESISSDDAIFEEYLRPVLLKVKDNGLFSYEYTDGLSNVKIYYRSDP